MKGTWLFLLAFVISACEKSTDDDPQKFSITLNECRQQVINDESAELCFDRLYESRCPLNVNCVWQGEATAKFSLKTKEQTISFALSTHNSLPYRQDTIISGYKISLKNVFPYPGGAVEPTRAELEITKQ